MAFLEKISKTVTEASQKTIAKTKELADTTKLNGMISEQEKAIAAQYSRIGELYVSLHKDDYEEAFSEMMIFIAEAETKIEACKAQIQEYKKVRVCENCGSQLPDNALFCSVCGSGVTQPHPEIPAHHVKCGHCGEVVKEGTRFCISCGKPMASEQEMIAEEDASTQFEEKVCPSCGEAMVADAEFCTECGTKL